MMGGWAVPGEQEGWRPRFVGGEEEGEGGRDEIRF